MADKQLIEGAYKAAKSGSYKSVDISGAFSGLAEVIQAKQKQAEKLQQDLESKTGYQPDITKVGANDVSALQSYFLNTKNQIADLHGKLKNASPTERNDINQQIATLQNTAKNSNQYLADLQELRTEYNDQYKNLSKIGDPVKNAKISEVLYNANYELVMDATGKPSYKIKEGDYKGQTITHDELDDWAVKNDKAAITIIKDADNVLSKGRQGVKMDNEDLSILKQKLNISLDDAAIESLIYDGAIDGYDFTSAIEEANLPADATPQQKKEIVINELMDRFKDINNSGYNKYLKNLPTDGTAKYTTSVSQEISAYETPLYNAAYNSSKGNVVGGIGFSKDIALDNINKSLKANDPDHSDLRTSKHPEIKSKLEEINKDKDKDEKISLEENALYYIDGNDLMKSNAALPNFEDHREVYFFMIDQNPNINPTVKRILKNRYVAPAKPTERQKAVSKIKTDII